MGFNSKYTSGKSVGKNQTVPIDVGDPRLKPGKIGQTKARQGAEIDIVGLDGKSLIMGGRGLNNSTGSMPGVPPIPPSFPGIVIPIGGNKPPKTYPNGTGPVIIVPTDPTNVTAEWINNDLVISFDWDFANELNDTISQFIVQLTSGGVTKRSQSNIFLPNTAQTRQTITVTKSIITSMFNVFKTGFSSICVLTGDPLNNISNTICALTIPTYVLSLPVPVITVSPIAGGYSVAYTTPTEDVYDAIDIAEYESTSLTEPTGVTYTRTYLGTINPANIISSGTNKRWVKARFSSEAGIYTAYSAAQAVTPTSPVVADNEGPPDTSNVSVSGGIDDTKQIGFNGYAIITWDAVRSVLANGTKTGIRGYRVKFWPVNKITGVALTDTDYSYRDFPGAGTFPGTISGRLNELAVGATYKFAVATYDEYNNTSSNYVEASTSFSVPGTPFIADVVDVKGYFKAQTGNDVGAFKFGYGIGSDINNPERGLSFNADNYWKITSGSTALLKVGGGDSNYIKWDGSDFLIDGNISARKGTFSGNVTVTGGGSLQSFTTTPTAFPISDVAYTASTATYTTGLINHGYVVGDDVLVSNLLPEGYNGKFKITARTLTTFTVTNTTNALVTDKIGSVVLVTGAGFVLNRDGLAFNSPTVRDITTIRSSDGLFTTKSANIGGWNVNDSSISRSGTANISLNSSAGNISVSSQNIAGYTAGINGPYISTGDTPSDNINGTPIGTENVFWAGSGGAIGTSNAFRVTLAGNLYASNAKITGTVSSVGALGTMTLDGEYGYMSLKTAGANAPVSYLVPRNNNIYLTSPSTTAPWSSGTQISSSGPTNGPYIVAGSSFKDYWNNTVLADGITTVKGVGLYTGRWDYFTLGASDPFIAASTTGIQLSVSPSLGLLLDKGSAETGDKLTPAIPQSTPSMLFYTARRTELGPKGQPIYSPNTEYGAWASFTNRVIKLTADEFLFINIEGSDTKANRKILMKATDAIAYQMSETGIKIQIDADTYQTFENDNITIQATGSVWQKFNSSGIRLQSSSTVFQEFTSSSITLTSGLTIGANASTGAYGGLSKIIINEVGVNITGIPRAATFDMQDYRSDRFVTINGSFVPTNNAYRNTPPLGYPPRQRAVIEDPVTGRAELGFGIYYMDVTKINIDETDLPSNTMGIVGDLAVMF
jgi:hypothetical protein